MSRIKGARRWPAVSVAVVAVLVALVGTAIAESGTATKSASVKKISKSVKRALRKSTRAVRIARKTSKQAGPQGVPGPQGARGPQGPSGVSGVEIVEEETAENGNPVKGVEATCPSGKRVLGGGANVEGEDFASVAIDWNAPEGSNAWFAAAHEHDAAANWALAVYAICANTD